MWITPRSHATSGTVLIEADALEYVREHGHLYDAIHASPPCQAYSRATKAWAHRANAREYPDLVAEDP